VQKSNWQTRRRTSRPTRFQRALRAAFDLEPDELDTLIDHLRIRARWLERLGWWKRSA
jgi:hypothetical protein